MNHEIDTETYTLIARDKEKKKRAFNLFNIPSRKKKFFFSSTKNILSLSFARRFLLKFAGGFRLLFIKIFYANNEIEFAQRHV